MLSMAHRVVTRYPFSKARELVLNGAYDSGVNWDMDSDWSIGSGVATKVAGAGNANLNQRNPQLRYGATYRTVFTLTRTAGSFTLFLNGTASNQGTARSTSGTFTQDITATGTAAASTINNNTGAAANGWTIRIQGNSTADGTVDDISVKRVHPTTPA